MNAAPQPPRRDRCRSTSSRRRNQATRSARHWPRALMKREGGALKLSGIGGRAMAAAGIDSPFADRRTVDHRAHRHSEANCRRFSAASAKRRPPSSPRGRMRSSSSTARISPIASRVGCGGWRRRSRSSIMSRRRSGRGGPGRARAMRAYVDQVLAILPFEPAVHLRLGGPPCLYVGHPLIERIGELRPGADEASAGAPIRRSCSPCPAAGPARSGAMLGIFGAAIERVIAQSSGRSRWCMPTVPHLADALREASAGWPVTPRIVVEPGGEMGRISRRPRGAGGVRHGHARTCACRRADGCGLSACRPSRRSCACSFACNRSLQSVILANLVIGENVVPELLQEDCTPETLAGALLPLLSDTPARRRQVEAFGRLDAIMAIGSMAPSAKAAGIVLEVARRGRVAQAHFGPTIARRILLTHASPLAETQLRRSRVSKTRKRSGSPRSVPQSPGYSAMCRRTC